jgi:RHS repeat-associated protein
MKIIYIITEIPDLQGNLVQRLWYNACGERELLVDNTGTGKPLFDRGFTTHEHLDEFGLINMNGRLYDPKLSQFLSPDNLVPLPFQYNLLRLTKYGSKT